MRRVTTVPSVRAAVAALHQGGQTVGFAATMGALHGGHLALVRAAAEHTDAVLVSIFVNPLQFGPGEDYLSYPRPAERDEAALLALGPATPAVLYTPTVAEMYPGWRPGSDPALDTTVSVRDLSDRLEGASRPGHFDGVCTVVTKLLHQVQPDVACFGRKDYQQLVIIRRMVADLDIPVEVVAVPTVREADGVAMSSRNAYLDVADRNAARCLSRGLAAAVEAARRVRDAGQPPDPEVLRRAALATIAAEPRAHVDYVAVVDPDTLAPPDGPARGTGTGVSTSARGPGTGRRLRQERLLVAVAVHVGPARLIDNVVVGDHDDEERLVHAVGGAASA
ncbi:MAG: pantoate--beta-alanine ligase [Actinobacteria bacterium]|nr:pantoate--beta-alanine ligase [Actinomycetota bacterium]